MKIHMIVLVVWLVTVNGDIETRMDGTHLKVYETSGKFEFGKYRMRTGEDSGTPTNGSSADDMVNGTITTETMVTTAEPQVERKVSVEFVSVAEVDSANNPVTNHSFTAFSSQNFTISSLMDTTYFNLSAKRLSLETSLIASAKLMIYVYVLSESGEISVGDEVQMVHSGQLRFTTHLSDWTWCSHNQCTQNGSAITVTFTAKGSGMAEKLSTTGGASVYKLGSGQNITMSNKVELDQGNWTSMSGDYPMMKSPSTFKIQFDKFTSQAIYDSVVDISLDEQDTDGDHGNEITSSATTPKPLIIVFYMVGTVSMICFRFFINLNLL